MGLDRCPSCAAAVRPGSDWCTLCYADVRPPPPPVARAPYPRPSAPPPYHSAPAPADALHAPYEHVLAAVYGGDAPAPPAAAFGPPAVTQPPAKPVGWPCTGCGELNGFERATCSVCLAPFGAALRTDVPVIDRKKMMAYAIGAAVAFLALVALVTFLTSKAPSTDQPEVLPEPPVSSTRLGPTPSVVGQLPGQTGVPAAGAVSPPPAEGAVSAPPAELGFVPGANLLESPTPAP
ncbi:MAG: hypothetical protein ABIM89_07065 [Mycobacteriales bacterium]